MKSLMKYKKHVLFFIILVAFVFVGFNSANKIYNAKQNIAMVTKNEEVKNLNLEYRQYSDYSVTYSMFFDSLKNTKLLALDISSDALNLRDYIGTSSISYREGDNWIEITEENNKNLSASADYQIMFTYENLLVSDLLKSDGQMVYDSIPEWFKPSDSGVILYGTDIVAQINASENTILITFDKSWLESLVKDSYLNGTFKINGQIDWSKLSGNEDVTFPDLNIDLNFENDLAQKYGNATIKKSAPTIVEDGENYYLKYEITVNSLENSLGIPNIIVKDTFTEQNYISCYIGISDNCDTPSKFIPQLGDGESLSIEENSMKWVIDELNAGETRILTYYVKIADSYIDNLLNNIIENKAELYSKEYKKDVDSSIIRPKTDLSLSKKTESMNVDSTGNGTITYVLTLIAPATNTYTMRNLTVTDFFPTNLKEYLTGDEEGKIEIFVNDKSQNVNYDNASFTLSNITINPAEKVTIKYTIHVKDIFFYNNGDVELTNTARVSGGNKILGTVINTETLKQSSVLRKVFGGVADDTTITEPKPDSIYKYEDEKIIKADDEEVTSFEVSDNSLKYQVVLNEDGNWDLSATSLKDTLGNYMQYEGYAQIQVYDDYKLENNKTYEDKEVVQDLSSKKATKVIWLKIADQTSFSFKPTDLELNEKYTYLLTYYAKPVGIENVGSIVLTNDFEIFGSVGIGNGNVKTMPPIKVSVNNVVQGGIHYKAKKSSWYYETSPVYETEAVKNGYYKRDGNDGFDIQYANGALYWVIRLEGNIPKGEKLQQTNNSTTFKGFYIKDTPDGTNKFNRDAILGVYKGPKTFDFTKYESYEDFLEESEDLEKLKGNSQNDKWFSQTRPSGDVDYEWYADNYDLNGFIFKNDYDLKDDEAIYIVLRTTPASPLPTSNTAYRIYKNNLKLGTDDNIPVDFGSAEYVYATESSLYKESKGAYAYNADKDEITNVSSFESYDNWTPDSIRDQLKQLGSGIYAPWLLNVNWDGTMEGSAIVSDQLPEGMEFKYADILHIGKDVRDDKIPVSDVITELEDSDEWVKYNQTNSNGNLITYYNPKTRELRWNITNLTKNEDGPTYNVRELNIRIISKIIDKDTLLSRNNKIFVNQASVDDIVTIADVTVNTKGSMDKNIDLEELKELGGNENNGSITGSLNSLPFKIEINPLKEDLSDTNILPPLIDELGENLILIEDSLKITYSDGTEYKGYSFVVEEKNNKQTIIISNLPDNTPLTITYEIRIDAKPNQSVKVSNLAYWTGYPPGEEQVDDKDFKYELQGDVFLNHPVTIEITKVDEESHNRKLSGAVFELYEVDSDNNNSLIATGTTNKNGKYVFESNENEDIKLQTNKVYFIKEKKAPNGYELDESPHYFVILSDSNDDSFDNYQIDGKDIDLEIWYESPNYSCVIENKKGVISVEKIFMDEYGMEKTPTEGKYNFGLYDSNKNLVETLTIEYTDSGLKYYLDGIEKDKPNFSKYDPESVYFIYELDGKGKSIENETLVKLNDINYKVTYTVGDKSTNRVTVNSTIKITNTKSIKKIPKSGGVGVLKYYIVGSILVLISIGYFIFRRRLRKQ